MVKLFIKVIFLMMFLSFPSYAGGSYESVKVKYFKLITETRYELEVTPIKGANSEYYSDPYMGTCETFTVYGDFSWFYSLFFFPKQMTKDSHLSSLRLLKEAHESGKPIDLGWIGQGFSRVYPNEPCIVRSRALQFNANFPNNITSFYDTF